MKIFFFLNLGSERETINLVPKIVPIIPANNAEGV